MTNDLLLPENVWLYYKVYQEHEQTHVSYPDLSKKYNLKLTNIYLFITRYKYKIKSNPVLYKTLLEKYAHFLELQKEDRGLKIKQYINQYYEKGNPVHFSEIAIHLKVNKIISEYLLKYGEPVFETYISPVVDRNIETDKSLEFFSFPVTEQIHHEENETQQEIINPEPGILMRGNSGGFEEYHEKPAKNDLELMLMDGVSVSIKKTVSTENVFKIINLLRAV